MKITYVNYYNWEGVYFGNQLQCQQFEVGLHEILPSLVGKIILEVECIRMDKELLGEGGLPETLIEFYKKEKINEH